MPLSVTCSFCGKQIEPGTGLMFVRNDNQRFYFCSHKCERNQLNLRRRARRIKWTSSYEKGPTPPQPEKKVDDETVEKPEEVQKKIKKKPSVAENKPEVEEEASEEEASEEESSPEKEAE